MVRFVAILLLAVFGASSVPVAAANAAPVLPACCRAHGKHRCALHPGGPGVALTTAACPLFPHAAQKAIVSRAALHRAASNSESPVPACFIVLRDANRAPAFHSREQTNRGPPSSPTAKL